ncbi:hypothetical protein [Trueperella pyogenes]|uniref:hypothetical protein n=1 Tax=Trueperella pyogenes TaxID=1661 RepID=UPI000F850257|nr:hypothetical protein [Trueperella pyogenes]AZR01627.1 hypothetical protein EB776_10175 [Trueperella pyogenes]AZR02890.1 hypothetical protein EB775_05975 [Trueperella pyogenes]UVJ56086.1 hypothetical protein M1F27_01840 [Trueperella pyogenes]WHU58824.1 hypothetical protein QEV21_09065 [Trueperella pyogenes]
MLKKSGFKQTNIALFFGVLLFATSVLVVAFFFWGWIFGVLAHPPKMFESLRTDQYPSVIGNVVTASLTTAGGVSVFVLMALNYRKQLLEEHRQVESERYQRDATAHTRSRRFAEFTEMLSKRDPALVMAGLKGIEDLSDSFAESVAAEKAEEEAAVNQFKQQCVDVLCAFIRSEGHRFNADELESVESKQVEVNQGLALRVIQEHVSKDISVEEKSWSKCTFDLHETIVACPVKFENVAFQALVELWGTKFERSFYAYGARFADVNFNGVEFKGKRIDFRSSEFDEITFQGNVCFEGATFFNGASFKRSVHFGSEDGGVIGYPGRTIFVQDVHFKGAEFADFADFSKVVFRKDVFLSRVRARVLSMRGAKVTGTLNLNDSQITAGLNLEKIHICEDLTMNQLEFPSGNGTEPAIYPDYAEADFYGAQICGNVSADKVQLPSKIVVTGLTICGTEFPSGVLMERAEI